MRREDIDADATSEVGLIAPKPPVEMYSEVTPEITVVITMTVTFVELVDPLKERIGVRPEDNVVATPRALVEVLNEMIPEPTEVTGAISLLDIVPLKIGSVETEGLITPAPPVELAL